MQRSLSTPVGGEGSVRALPVTLVHHHAPPVVMPLDRFYLPNPAANSSASCAASNMSSRSAMSRWDGSDINGLSLRQNTPTADVVATDLDGLPFNEIDGTAKQRFKCLLEVNEGRERVGH